MNVGVHLRGTCPHLLCLVLAVVVSSCSKQDEDVISPIDPLPAGADNAPVRVGQPAPDFEAVAHSGQKVRLSELRGKAVILYFYPKDGTPGCTAEAKGFRDEHTSLDRAGAVVIGVSTQDNESHQEFAERYQLPFLLLPDEDSKIAQTYGVGSVLGFSKRVTFIIDRQGRIAKVYEKVSPPGHAEEILETIELLPPATEP
jgi:thioredoxin-dependent peroxiredoxin